MNDVMNMRLESLDFICACRVSLDKDLSCGAINLLCTSALFISIFRLPDNVILLCVVSCRPHCRMK